MIRKFLLLFVIGCGHSGDVDVDVTAPDGGGGAGDASVGDPSGALFRTADAAHMNRAWAAVTRDATEAAKLALTWSRYDDVTDPCPTVTTEGQTTTVTGGCTRNDGTAFGGEIVVHNVHPILGGTGDPSQPMTLTFTHAVVGLAELDGMFTFDNTLHLTGHLTRTADGIAATTDLELLLSADGVKSTALAGSRADVEGLGHFTATGSWSNSTLKPLGTVTFIGADVVTIDAAQESGSCAPYTIDDGSSGQVCAPQ